MGGREWEDFEKKMKDMEERLKKNLDNKDNNKDDGRGTMNQGPKVQVRQHRKGVEIKIGNNASTWNTTTYSSNSSTNQRYQEMTQQNKNTIKIANEQIQQAMQQIPQGTIIPAAMKQMNEGMEKAQKQIQKAMQQAYVPQQQGVRIQKILDEMMKQNMQQRQQAQQQKDQARKQNEEHKKRDEEARSGKMSGRVEESGELKVSD